MREPAFGPAFFEWAPTNVGIARQTGTRAVRMHLWRRCSEVLNPTDHLLGFVDLPDEDKALEDFADGFAVLGAIGDARVCDPLGVESEDLLVFGEDDSSL